MPSETDAAFVAIDEVQIAGDLERGHIFTDRILNLRGSQETLLLGAATMRESIEKLLPGVHVVTRPRMSVLAYAGQKKLTRLPERSAIVAFSADEVYAVAELIRRQRGGAAVVLGALSPRTRNKQVEIYQAGDVDFLIATDAIGMGLNLDLDHVAFAAHRKFDGYQYRDLTAAELGQIAGRAGRHMRDGTFGVTGRVDPFPDPLVEALETHRFEPVRTLQWRNDELDFGSIAALKASLDQPARVEGLTKAPPADDQVALEALARDEEIADKARRPEQVRRLWDVCRLPDYRKIAPAQHAELIGAIFGFIADGGTVPDDWIAEQVKSATHTEGDIDTLSSRIAHIRTWTFVANQPDWLADPVSWRDQTRAVEDSLSDALHERLTQRFIDRRTSVLMRRLRENTSLEAEITPSGDVVVEGHHVGALNGFRFTADAQAEGADAQALRNAAQKALASAMTDRAERLSRARDADIVLSLDGHLRWQGEPVARLVAGDDALKPRIVVLADEQLSGPAKAQVESRLTAWLTTHVGTLLKPLIDLGSDPALTGMARGVAFRLVEQFGLLDRREVADDIRGLDQESRALLRRHGVRFGAHHIYVPALLKPGPSTLIAQLWALKSKDLETPGLNELSAVSGSGRTSAKIEAGFDPQLYLRLGFKVYGQRAVRIDILERLADLIRPALAWRPGTTGERPPGALPDGRGFTVTPAMTSLLGASGEDFAAVLQGLGYRMDRKPKPAEPPPTPAEAVAAAAEPDALEPVELGELSGPGVPAPETPPQPPLEEPPVQEPAVEPPPGEETPAEKPPLEEPPAGDPPQQEPPAEIPPVQDPVAPTAGPDTDDSPALAAMPPDEPSAPAEPEMIEVWRPAGSGRPRRHTEHRRPEAGDGERQQRRRRGPPDGGERRFRKPAPIAAATAEAGAAEQQPDRPPRDKRPRPPRHRDGRRPDTRRPDDRPPRQDFRERPRERPVDPDSPFAALAALKGKLEQSNRE